MKPVESKHSLPLPAWLDVLRAVLPPRGVLLVGAGTGQGPWVRWLQSRGIKQVCLVEGDEQQFQHLVNSLPLDAGWMPRRDVVAVSAEPVAFHRASNPAESGLIAPERLRALWPNLTSEGNAETAAETAVTLDMLNADAGNSLNWLVLDCLPAAQLLQGGAQLLGTLDLVLVRVAVDKTSDLEPFASHEAADELLRAAGLHCVHIQAERHPALAHALYVRNFAAQLHRTLEQLHVAQESWLKEKAELAQARDAERGEVQKAAEQLRTAQEVWVKEKSELTQARDAAHGEAQKTAGQLRTAQEAWIKEKRELTQALDAARSEAKKATEQLRMAQEGWAKEINELTQARDAARTEAQKTADLFRLGVKERSELTQARDAARGEAQKAAEQLHAAQEKWNKEKSELTQARDVARSEAQKAAEQLRSAQEAWAREKGELTQARDTARSESQKAVEQLKQLREVQDGWTKEKNELAQAHEAALAKLRTQLQQQAKPKGDDDIDDLIDDLAMLFYGKTIVYVDVGAYVGAVFKKLLDSKKLKIFQAYLYEPNPSSFAQLSQAIQGITSPTVHAHHLAVGKGEGVLNFAANKSMTKAVDAGYQGLEDVFSTPCITLDSQSGLFTEGHIHLLKLDVEGGEMDVLQGAAGLLQKQAIDVLYIEVGFNRQGWQQTYFGDIDAYMQSMGYRVFKIYEQKNEWMDDSPLLRRCNFAYMSQKFAQAYPLKLMQELRKLKTEVVKA